MRLAGSLLTARFLGRGLEAVRATSDRGILFGIPENQLSAESRTLVAANPHSATRVLTGFLLLLEQDHESPSGTGTRP